MRDGSSCGAPAALRSARRVRREVRGNGPGAISEPRPGRTQPRVVDLTEGREGLDFLGCHFRARMSGRIREQRRVRRYYLHRWPSQRAMKRLREIIRDRTGRNRAGMDIREVIADINPLLRGWGTTSAPGTPAPRSGRPSTTSSFASAG
jgi:hypothetical protein